jgi:cyclase
MILEMFCDHPAIQIIILPICFIALLGGPFYAPAVAKDNAELVKLADGVFARIVSPDSNAVANSGFVILDRSVLVFDTHFTPEAAQALLAEIRSVTPKPIRYVVNSHSHADHTHGNQAFPEAQLIGSTNARREVLEVDLPSLNRTVNTTERQLEKLRQEAIKEKDPSQKRRYYEQIKTREDYVRTVSRLKILAPFITLDDNLTIRDGQQEACIAFLGAGHTEGDVILFLPSQKIAFVGDLFFNEAIPNVQDANILPWMKTIESILRLSAEKFIPGHGRAGSKKDVEAFLAYFEELKAMVQPAVDRGDSVDQVIKDIQLPPKYASYRFQNFFPSNIQKMYEELKAIQISAKSSEGSTKKDGGNLPK